MNKTTNTIITAVAVSLLASAAHAGGFSRGSADLGILYQSDPVSARIQSTYVNPNRGYETINGMAGTDDDYSNDYVIPSAAFKVNLTDNFRCAGTYTQPYGASSNYGTQAQIADFAGGGNGIISNSFTVDEYGATCAASFDAGKGQFWLLGGIFWEKFAYEEVTLSGRLNLDGDFNHGYRLGAAYTIPEIALRIQALYRSEVSHDVSGNTIANVAVGPFPALTPLPTAGAGTLPQSFELKAQSGIAPGTLAFASIKWTDWSVLQTIDYGITALGPLGLSSKEFFWQDGWKISGGIGKVINDNMSAAISLTWDKGVSTTEDAFTDTWTLGAGVEIKDKFGGKWSLGAGVSYLTSGSVAVATSGNGTGAGGSFAYTVGNDWAYAGSLAYKFKF